MKEEMSLEEIDSLIKNKKVLSINKDIEVDEDIEDKLLKIANEEGISSVLKIDDGIDEVIL